jgi:hypothetical protein
VGDAHLSSQKLPIEPIYIHGVGKNGRLADDRRRHATRKRAFQHATSSAFRIPNSERRKRLG